MHAPQIVEIHHINSVDHQMYRPTGPFSEEQGRDGLMTTVITEIAAFQVVPSGLLAGE